MTAHSVLRTAPEYPQSQRPDLVQALPRPVALVQVRELAFLMFEKPDLRRTDRFWQDFGLITVSLTTDRLVMRAAGSAPAFLVVTKAAQVRYVGAAFVVNDEVDFGPILAHSRPLSSEDIPGGVQGVALIDPDGHAVWLIQRWDRVTPMPLTDRMNTLVQVRRINDTVRPPIEPARVRRLGHVVLQSTNFATMRTGTCVTHHALESAAAAMERPHDPSPSSNDRRRGRCTRPPLALNLPTDFLHPINQECTPWPFTLFDF